MWSREGTLYGSGTVIHSARFRISTGARTAKRWLRPGLTGRSPCRMTKESGSR